MDGMFDALEKAFWIMFLFLPLGLWKAVEIAIWLVHHFRVHIQ